MTENFESRKETIKNFLTELSSILKKYNVSVTSVAGFLNEEQNAINSAIYVSGKDWAVHLNVSENEVATVTFDTIEKVINTVKNSCF